MAKRLTRNKGYRLRLNEFEEELIESGAKRNQLSKSDYLRSLFYRDNEVEYLMPDFYIQKVIQSLNELKKYYPNTKIYIEIEGNMAEYKLGDALIYDTPDGRIAIDAE